jgi:lipoprotein-releasing system permease protein
MGVMNGLQRDLRDKILIGSPDIRVLVYGDDLLIRDWQPILKKVVAQPGIVAAAPFVHTKGVISAGHEYSDGVFLVGLEPQRPGVADVTSIRTHALTGDFRFRTSDGSTRGVVVGKLLAARLNAFVGDTITLLTLKSTQVNAAIGAALPQPVQNRFEVTGVFETGMYEYDDQYLYMPLEVAQEIAGLGTAVTGIEARTADRWQAQEIGRALDATLGFPYRAMDWQEQNKSLFRALKLEKLGMGLILLLIVLVAAFNIVSNLIMVVSDKTREIGILRAMGMTARSIRNVFFAQGLVIGVVGTLVGVALGIVVATAIGSYRVIPLDPQIYFIDHLPVSTEAADVVLVLVASIAIAALATLYPAVQAARLYPVQAIRHE